MQLATTPGRFSHVVSGVALVAVAAEGLAVYEVGIRLGKLLAALGAGAVGEHARALGQRHFDRLDVEQLGRLVPLIVREAVLAGHALGLGSEDKPHALAARALVEAEGHLAGQVEHEVPLPRAASMTCMASTQQASFSQIQQTSSSPENCSPSSSIAYSAAL